MIQVAEYSTPVWVVGSDCDRGMVQSLTEGDSVLVEINGTRVFSTNPCPMVSDGIWKVISNGGPTDTRKLVLRHSIQDRELVLPYRELLKAPQHQPAVFVIYDKDLSAGPMYCIIQLPAYSISTDQVNQFKPEFDDGFIDEAFENSDARHAVLDKLIKAIKGFKHPGWEYQSVCRFALRSNVRAKVIELFRTGTMEEIEKVHIDLVKRITKELGWLKQLRSVDAVSVNCEREAPAEWLRKVKHEDGV